MLQQQEEHGKQLAALNQSAVRSSAAGASVVAPVTKKLTIDEGTAVSAVEAYQGLAGGANAGAVVASFAVEHETQRRRVAAFQ